MENYRYSATKSLLLILFVTMFSCNKKTESHSNLNGMLRNYMVQIESDFVFSTILEYAKEHKVDSSKAIISINVKTDSYRTSVYISHTTIDLNKFEILPGRYSLVENYLVLIYSDVDKFVKHPFIKDELKEVISENQIGLDTAETLYEVPTWKISKCEDRIVKQLETDEIELPCFYKIDEINGELKIVEEEWFKELKAKKNQ
jgi:hypothetical protein